MKGTFWCDLRRLWIELSSFFDTASFVGPVKGHSSFETTCVVLWNVLFKTGSVCYSTSARPAAANWKCSLEKPLPLPENCPATPQLFTPTTKTSPPVIDCEATLLLLTSPLPLGVFVLILTLGGCYWGSWSDRTQKTF